MKQKNYRVLKSIDMVVDAVTIVASYCIASFFWLNFLNRGNNIAAWSDRLIPIAAIIYAFVFWIVVSILGLYNVRKYYSIPQKFFMIVVANTMTVITATSFLYVYRLQEFSRGVILSFFLLSNLLLLLKYAIQRLISSFLRKKGKSLRRVFIIGNGDIAKQYYDDVCSSEKYGYSFTGFAGNSESTSNLNAVCDYDGVDEFLHLTDIDEVVIALESNEQCHMEKMILLCEKNGVRYSVIPFYNRILPPQSEIERIEGCTLINLRRNRLENIVYAFIKRSFDIVASALGLMMLSPIFAFVSIGVLLSSPGPILFKQKRVGYEKREFMMLKFRSMRVNSNENTGWTTDSDSRKTKFGSFIRKYSIDEFPQLWNVLIGDMSLVGPRPELPFFVEKFREEIPLYMVKHQVRPGITGWAQVNGYRGDTSIEKRIEHDIWYIENWSVGLDIKILFLTVFGGMKNSENIVK